MARPRLHGGVFLFVHEFHASDPDDHRSREGRRAYKQLLVNRGPAHAALVFDGDSRLICVLVDKGCVGCGCCIRPSELSAAMMLAISPAPCRMGYESCGR